ncbi:glycoside hydrolase family 15 [Candidatus Woesearchaeota archaeon]|nr:glycoside hydrolase family 15 [Candidatus Woesearchaeota archaeon]
MKRSTKSKGHKQLIKHHMKILRGLQYKSGLFAASNKNVSTGYDKSWLRDNFYECLAFEVLGDWDTVEKTYTALLKAFLKHEYKIDVAIERKPQYKHEYIHARVHPETFDEFWEDWGNKQNDAVGAILFRIGELERNRPGCLLKNENFIRITNKLVQYLNSIEYWHDEDNGMWEENEEIHASSVGACVAGLKAVAKLSHIQVPKELIKKGEMTLNQMLPRESAGKFVDLALLSLIYPYNVVTAKQRDEILDHVEYLLERKKGVIRYKNDYYYNKNPDGYSEEAEWTFGFSWLAIIYEKLGNKKKAKKYVDNMLKTDTKDGIPELYYSNTDKPNENTPLGWAESLFVVALYNLNKKFTHKKNR